MLKIFDTQDYVQAGMVYSLLENAGVECVYKNQFAASAIGEVPFQELWPEIWLVNASDEPKARCLIDEHLSVKDGPDWQCKECGETLPASFETCWQCGSANF